MAEGWRFPLCSSRHDVGVGDGQAGGGDDVEGFCRVDGSMCAILDGPESSTGDQLRVVYVFLGKR